MAGTRRLPATSFIVHTHRGQYLTKRRAVLRSEPHFVELDLLRGGQPMPENGRPPCAYSVLVSRAEQRPRAGFWPIDPRDPAADPDPPTTARPQRRATLRLAAT